MPCFLYCVHNIFLCLLLLYWMYAMHVAHNMLIHVVACVCPVCVLLLVIASSFVHHTTFVDFLEQLLLCSVLSFSSVYLFPCLVIVCSRLQLYLVGSLISYFHSINFPITNDLMLFSDSDLFYIYYNDQITPWKSPDDKSPPHRRWHRQPPASEPGLYILWIFLLNDPTNWANI